MKPTDFKDQKPRLIIEEYLTGNVKAYGILQNRSGKVTRQFNVDLDGKWDGNKLILDEKFNWNDGEIKTDNGRLTSSMNIIMKERLAMLLEPLKVSHMVPHLSLKYVLLVPVKGKEIKITFDDWILSKTNE